MVHPSKANALNKRSNSAIKDLARWNEYLRSELRKQSHLERPVGGSKYSDELYPETIELKRKDIELLADRFATNVAIKVALTKRLANLPALCERTLHG